ncbi:hypothetical protein L0337_12110, partial [candidate division KSB1 bacterium]|nr:hypothetical protein [candidate division KSB1 bacterium]
MRQATTFESLFSKSTCFEKNKSYIILYPTFRRSGTSIFGFSGHSVFRKAMIQNTQIKNQA